LQQPLTSYLPGRAIWVEPGRSGKRKTKSTDARECDANGDLAQTSAALGGVRADIEV